MEMILKYQYETSFPVIFIEIYLHSLEGFLLSFSLEILSVAQSIYFIRDSYFKDKLLTEKNASAFYLSEKEH